MPILSRKEIENYALIPVAISRAIEKRLHERSRIDNNAPVFVDDIRTLLYELTEPLKNRVSSKYMARRRPFEKAKTPHRDVSTIDEQLMTEFDAVWHSERRLDLVPGKETFALLNRYLQDKYSVSVSPAGVVANLKNSEIPEDMIALIEEIDLFRKSKPIS